jgi:hypothetical protein
MNWPAPRRRWTPDRAGGRCPGWAARRWLKTSGEERRSPGRVPQALPGRAGVRRSRPRHGQEDQAVRLRRTVLWQSRLREPPPDINRAANRKQFCPARQKAPRTNLFSPARLTSGSCGPLLAGLGGAQTSPTSADALAGRANRRGPMGGRSWRSWKAGGRNRWEARARGGCGAGASCPR